MNSPLKIAAIDAAMAIEEKLINPKVGTRDVTVDSRGKIRTWATGTVPAQNRPHIVGSYDARATVEMIAEDLLAAPHFVEAHA
jgi:hypothetical protein